MVLADLLHALEPVALEQGHRGVVEERARHLAPGGVLRVALHHAATQPADLLERRRYYRMSEDGAERARIALAQASTSVITLGLRARPAGGLT